MTVGWAKFFVTLFVLMVIGMLVFAVIQQPILALVLIGAGIAVGGAIGIVTLLDANEYAERVTKGDKSDTD